MTLEFARKFMIAVANIYKTISDMKIKIELKYAKGEYDTNDIVLVDIPANSIKCEKDSEIAIKDGTNFVVAKVHTGNADSSSELAKEIVNRFNGLRWRNASDELPDDNQYVLAVTCCFNYWVLRRHHDRWEDEYGRAITAAIITHWIPLPRAQSELACIEEEMMLETQSNQNEKP